ncbi:MAG: CarD family transcriptional regulator [Chloroflexota bacterium]|nr:CarD family transcriptional regulator [Chloroflexota bacterium]
MVSKKTAKFKVGDWIVHHYYGVGEVKGILEKGVDEDRQTFYKVKTNKIVYWLPVGEEDSDHIEPLRTKLDFQAALKTIAAQPERLAIHHKARKKNINDRWKDGDLKARARLMRDLNGRLKRNKLNFNEKELFKKVQKHFIDEWLLADATMTRKEAQKQLNEALQESVKKERKAKNEKEKAEA